MSTTADVLRELHRVHRQLTDLNGQIERGPRQVRAGEAALERLRQQLVEAKQTLTKTRVACDEKQLQLRGREDRLADLKAKLNSCNSNREYQALQEQIAADTQASNVLSDEILEALDRIDELHRQAAEAEAQLQQTGQELERTRSRVDQQQQALQGQLAAVTESLKQAEAAMPVELKTDYLRMARARGEDALAQVENGCCGACYRTLSPQTMSELMMGKPVVCKSCACLLYLPEGDASAER